MDESALDLTYELDSSFKRMLDEKRQMTNKENNPPSVEESAASVNPPEKPLRKDLLKDREYISGLLAIFSQHKSFSN